ncbi:MAG: hypothetical protein HKN26_14200 [Acidimicrobiales bacterium]|nr:hypothetical protein [Acidimicrobiales bacterium]
MAIVVALAATSMVLLRGNADPGGAPTPEAAVEALLNAVAEEDFIGAAEAMAPEEREALINPLFEIVGELQRLGILSDRLDLGQVDGFDVEFDGLSYQNRTLGTGVSLISVLGEYEVSASGDLPIGDVFSDFMDGSDGVELEAMTESGEVDFEVVVVERDGQWFVSLFYTLAELARAETDLPAPDFGNGIRPVGAESPEGAIRAMLEAAIDLDAEAAIAQLPPTEMAVLYDYAPLFLDDIDEAANGYRQEEDFRATLGHFGASADVDGKRATVRVEDVAIELTGNPGRVIIDTRADCVIEVVGEPTCEVSAADYEDGLDQLQLDGELPGIRTVQVDGRWYVSPLDTGLTAVLGALGEIERSDVEAFLADGLSAIIGLLFAAALAGSPGELVEEFTEEGFGSSGNVIGETNWDALDPDPGDDEPMFTEIPVFTYEALEPVPAGALLSDAVALGMIEAIETPIGEADPALFWTDKLYGDEILRESIDRGPVRWEHIGFEGESFKPDAGAPDDLFELELEPGFATTTTAFALGPIGG